MRGSFKSYKSQYSSAQEDVVSDDDFSKSDPSSPSSTTIAEYMATKEAESTTVYGTTWMAWIQVINIMLVNGCCSLMWASGAASPQAVSSWLNIHLTALNWLSNSSAVINAIFSFVTGWSYQRFGIKTNVNMNK
jgi:hypothetical protein